VAVVGGEKDNVTACTLPVKDGHKLTIGEATQVNVLFSPCHTRGHVLYHVTAQPSSATTSPQAGAVFTGDTLFIAGCGRFFEGSAAEMHHNLNTLVASLPASTAVYCGHEYTQSNLEFAAWAEPSNADVKAKLQWAKERRRQRLSTLGTTVAEEQRINPFMRVGVQEIAQRVARWLDKNVDGNEQVRVMAAVREAKDQKAHQQAASL
jgi:hydroxyacylglutathione hydrolase